MHMVRQSLDCVQRFVSGAVWLQLHKGNVIVKGRTSLTSSYRTDLASMCMEDGGESFDYNPTDA